MLELVICVTDTKSRIDNIDTDNLAKSVMDALKGVLCHDDNQVYYLNVIKDYFQKSAFKSLMVAARKIKNTGDTAYPIKLFILEDKIISEDTANTSDIAS